MKKCIGLASIITLLGMGVSVYAAPIENWVSLSLSNLPAKAKIGQTYSDVVLNVTNPNSQTIYLNRLLDPQYPAGFTVTSNTCENISLAQNASCKVTGNYIPESVNQNVWSTRVAVEGVGWQKVYSTSVVADGLDLDADKDVNKMVAFNGDTDTGTITVTNNSAETLTNINAALVTAVPGVSIGSNSNCSTSLAVGDSCTFTVNYESPDNATNVNIQRAIADLRFTYGTSYATESFDDDLNILGVKKGYYLSLPTLDKGISLASPYVSKIAVYNEGKDMYVATDGGLSISHDSGATYRSYTTNDGLANNRIRAVDASADGQIIALASSSGLTLSTDGGKTFTVKTTEDGLGSNAISDVKIVQGKIYAATNGGISVSSDDGQSFQSITTSSGLGSNSVYGLAISADGQTILAGTLDGLSISKNGGQSFVNRTSADGLYNNTVLYVAMSSDGQSIYTVNYYGGLNKSTDGGASFTPVIVPGLSSLILYGVSVSPDGQTVLVSSTTGLGLSTDGGTTYTVKKEADGLSNDRVMSTTYDADTGNIYVATDGGLSELKQGAATFTANTSSLGLASEDLRALMMSPDGSKIYVGSYEGGLNISSDNGFTFSQVTSGLPSRTVSSLAQSSDGQKIYAASTKGLSVSTDGGAHFTQLSSLCGSDAPSVDGLYVNPVTGKVYAGVYYNTDTSYVNALAVADPGMINPNCLTPENSGLPNNLIMQVAASNDDQKIYLATNGGLGLGISTDAGQTFALKTVANGLGNNNNDNVQIANDGQTVYASSFAGLSISTNGGNAYTNYTTANGLAGNGVRGIVTANDGQTWYVPVYGGLSVSHDGGSTFTTMTTADGLGSNNVRMPVLTKDGTGIFVPTEEGLYFTKFAS